jgi:seryl-tRNA synthetase
VYLKNEAALLELALVNWALQKMTAYGYTAVSTPDAVHPRIAEACGFQPRDAKHTHLYHLENENLVLAGTSELLLAALHADKTYPVEQLPIRLVGFSHCFRAGNFMSTNSTEAGAGGREAKGLYRVHQFSKVEMFVVGTEETSGTLHDEILQYQIELLNELGLHAQ